jgi:hypothetical protein
MTRKKNAFVDNEGRPISEGFYDDVRDSQHRNLVYLERYNDTTRLWEGIGSDEATSDQICAKELRNYQRLTVRNAIIAAVESPFSFRRLGQIALEKWIANLNKN